MLFFLIFVPWLGLLALGALLFLARQYRYLSIYLFLGSTCGFIGAFILSFFSIYLTTLLPESKSTLDTFLFLGVYLGCIAAGGILGATIGINAAKKLIQSSGWLQPLPTTTSLKL